MKVFIYMGVTPNGYIAKEDGESRWTSDENLNGFFDNCKKSGNIIMGKNTFQEALKYGYFPFANALNIVFSHEKIENKWGENVLFTDKTPEEILNFLSQKGFKSAFLAGGGKLNSSFLEKGLVDEIYLDVEPIIFGKGISLTAASVFEYEMKLQGFKKLNKDTIQLHYILDKQKN